ncbi:MAG TPA: DUF2690 domain-containing protein [Acidimicrobiales bacterium]|nr:DUF2690 domain-containing protein [Acidimicrobiales bacterium]
MTRPFALPRRGLGRLVAAVALAGGLVAAMASPANALAYDYTDPATTGCSATAITVASTAVIDSRNGANVGTVELRWSTACKTNWARVTRTDGQNALWSNVTVTRASTSDTTTFSAQGYSSIYSDQLYGQGYVVCASAMLERPNEGGAFGEGACY